jgi:hypothetical protein
VQINLALLPDSANVFFINTLWLWKHISPASFLLKTCFPLQLIIPHLQEPPPPVDPFPLPPFSVPLFLLVSRFLPWRLIRKFLRNVTTSIPNYAAPKLIIQYSSYYGLAFYILHGLERIFAHFPGKVPTFDSIFLFRLTPRFKAYILSVFV